MVKKFTEKELLKQLTESNEQAFKNLFDTYHERLFHYISNIIKSDLVAEELVMDVFLKIWLARKMASDIENFEAFIFRIAHNKSIDFLRSVAKNPKFKDLLWEQMSLSGSNNADFMLLQQEFEAKLREALLLLSPQRKKVYQLSRQNEMSHDQIAAHLLISKNTVNNHIVEAQGFIRRYLSKTLDISFFLAMVIGLL